MEPGEDVAAIDQLERGLLLDRGTDGEPADDDGRINGDDAEEPVLYTASFDEAEENFIKYHTAKWVLYSLLLVLAWGIGLLMLIYLPLRRYTLRKDIRSRKLYLTPKAIVYKIRRPVSFPCFGNLTKEKHILLPSVADVVVEQGYMQSLFGVYSLRIENVGVRRPPSEDVNIHGVANPLAFKKAVRVYLSALRGEAFSRQTSTVEDVSTPKFGQSSVVLMSPSRPLRYDSFAHHSELAILQKLEEVGSSVKKVQTLIEGQNLQTPETAD